MYYGDKRSSKVVLAEHLRENGWNILGWKADRSDSMSDYYCPASWGGIATKGDAVLVVDRSWGNEESGCEIKERVEGYNPINDSNKMMKLQALADCKTAPEGERSAAKAAMERLSEANRENEESGWKVVGHYPVFQQNPDRANWHLEIGGHLVAKGNGIFQFCKCEYLGTWENPLDMKTLQFKDPKREDDLEEYQLKSLNKLRKFSKKLEKLVGESNQIGEGKRTRLKKKNVQKKKKVMVADVVKFDGNFKVGECFIFKKAESYRGVRYCSVDPSRSVGDVYQIDTVEDGYFYAYKFRKGLKSLANKGWSSRKLFRNDLMKQHHEKGCLDMVEVIEKVVVVDNVKYEVER